MSDRRMFLRNGLILCLSAGGMVWTRQASGLTRTTAADARWGMIIDTNRCTGCRSCMVACKLQNNTAANRFNTAVREQESGHYPAARIAFTPALCNQCYDPPCAPACPEAAIAKLPNGIVVTDWNKCTGRGDCVTACPYGARFQDPRFGEKADKCDFCLDRLQQGLEPACVEACAPGARVWGDFKAPAGAFAKYLQQGGLTSRLPQLGIKTQVLYAPQESPKERIS